MSERQEKIAIKILEECRKLYDLRKNKKKYNEKIQKLTNKLEKTKLISLIEPIYFEGYLRITLGNEIPRMEKEEFVNKLETFLKIKTRYYYFHMPEFRNFPVNITIGAGRIIKFDDLPELVQDRVKLAHAEKGIINDDWIKTMMESWIAEQTIMSADPEQGYWIEIISKAISPSMLNNKAYSQIEDSLDILRFIKRLSLRSPTIAFKFDPQENVSEPIIRSIKFTRWDYEEEYSHQIEKLSESCCKKKRTDIEQRLWDALLYYRIGKLNSPDHQKLFFYIAAIEHLILGTNDRQVLRWKFSEKGAILLADSIQERILKSKELKDLYDKRSKIAHGSKSEYDFHATLDAERSFSYIFMKILSLIEINGIKRLSKKGLIDKESLDGFIEQIIYSG